MAQELESIIRTGLIVPDEAGEVTLTYPTTGQTISLSEASDTELAEFDEDVQDWIRRAGEARAMAKRELVRRMDKRAVWTIRGGGFKITAPSPAPSRYVTDAKALRSALLKLVKNGAIDQSAVDVAVKRTVKVEVRASIPKLDALRKLGGIVAETIDSYVNTAERADRSATITREG